MKGMEKFSNHKSIREYIWSGTNYGSKNQHLSHFVGKNSISHKTIFNYSTTQEKKNPKSPNAKYLETQ